LSTATIRHPAGPRLSNDYSFTVGGDDLPVAQERVEPLPRSRALLVLDDLGSVLHEVDPAETVGEVRAVMGGRVEALTK